MTSVLCIHSPGHLGHLVCKVTGLVYLQIFHADKSHEIDSKSDLDPSSMCDGEDSEDPSRLSAWWCYRSSLSEAREGPLIDQPCVGSNPQ